MPVDGYQCFPVLSALNQPQPLAVDDDDYSYDDDDDDYIYDDYAQVVPVDGYQCPQSYLLLNSLNHWLSDQASFWWMVDKSAVG